MAVFLWCVFLWEPQIIGSFAVLVNFERKFVQHGSPFSRLTKPFPSLLKVTDFIKFTKERIISLQSNWEVIFLSAKKYIINLAFHTKAAGNWRITLNVRSRFIRIGYKTKLSLLGIFTESFQSPSLLNIARKHKLFHLNAW